MWGQRELEVAGLAKIDLAARKNIASALVLNKFQNKSYFFGISGLQNYGLLNDPSLSAPVAPTTGVGGTTWPVKTPSEIFSDIQKLYVTLVNQTGGIIEADAKLVLAVSPASAGYLMNSNPVFGLTARAQIEMNFPNLRIETAVEYTTGSGELVQLIAEDIEGQEVATCAFNEKMRAHPIVVDTSWFRQKKTCGTFGAIIYQPMGIAAMIGV
jgi:hypothetical protein